MENDKEYKFRIYPPPDWKKKHRDSAFVFLFVRTAWNEYDLEDLFYERGREEKIKLYDELYRRSEILK